MSARAKSISFDLELIHLTFQFLYNPVFAASLSREFREDLTFKEQTSRVGVCQNVGGVKSTPVIISICSSMFFSTTVKSYFILTSKTILKPYS